MSCEVVNDLNLRHFIRGLSDEEVRLASDALHNSVVLTVEDWRSVKSMLCASISDAVQMEGLTQKWSVDWTVLKSKLESLEDWQAVALCAWVAGQRDSEVVFG